jgi:hypothetical protein
MNEGERRNPDELLADVQRDDARARLRRLGDRASRHMAAAATLPA